MMAGKGSALLLICIVAAANAASFNHILKRVHPDNANEVYEYEPMHEEYDYVTAEHHFDAPMDPFTKVMNDHSDDIEHAFESVYFSVDGFGANAEAFMTALAPIAEHFNEKYVKALLPMIEATPAETLKSTVINILKALKGTIDEVATLLVERNPLHPQKSPFDTPRAFGRAVVDHIKRKFKTPEIMTLGIWGKYLGEAIGTVDAVLVDLVGAVATKMKEGETQLDMMISQLEGVPAELLKSLAVSGLKDKTG